MIDTPSSAPDRSASRRAVLRAGGMAVGAAVFPAPAFAVPAGQPPGIQEGFTRDKIWGWHEDLSERGPRLTGSAAHAHYVDFLGDQLERLGLRVSRDRLTFTRWEAKRWSLTVNGSPVPVAFYFPYSGVTPPGGITAPLVYLGPAPVSVAGEVTIPSPVWQLARGKIAVVDCAVVPLPYSAAFREQGSYPTDAEAPPTITYAPSVQDILTPPDLASAGDAGVLGVICVRTGVSDELAADQYSPFTTPYQDCPGLWVNATTGNQIRAQALVGATATLTLDAELVRGAATETIYTVIPGNDPRENVIVNTHTDGPNVAEENGGLGMLSLAKQFRAARLKRSMVFVFATGHFQLPQFARDGDPLNQASSRWMDMHPELHDGRGTNKKTVAALTVEHLGCREWVDNAAHTGYSPTGLNEVGWCYTTTPSMRRIWLDSANGTTNRRTFAAVPNPPFYFGEGGPFYKAGIATMSLIPGQTYLCSAPPDGNLAKLDKNLIMGQIKTFDRALRTLEETSTASIGVPGFTL